MSDFEPAPDQPSADPPVDAAASANSSLIAVDLDNSFSESRRLRADGWTSFTRRAFLDDLAERGSVTAACRTTGMSARAAYNLRNRDPMFAIAWHAALVFARQRLADDVLDRSISGCVEQIWKNGIIVGERHRYDNKLSIAVLTRLDRQLDRAELLGQAHLRAAGQWEAFVDAVAEERVADAEALIAPPPDHSELHELSRGFSHLSADSDFAGDDDMDEAEDDSRVWIDDHSWRTNFPPPADFRGYEDGIYGDLGYSRHCTPEERAVLDRRYPADCQQPSGRERTRLEDEELCTTYFKQIADAFEAEGPAPPLEDETAALDPNEPPSG